MVFDLADPPGDLSRFCQENQKSFEFIRGDVREDIPTGPFVGCGEGSWIFNFAAVHREPGHAYHEYFDTNIPGAENVCEFASATGIQKILFTSSIAPYGKSRESRSEDSPLYPETAYGISKAIAERIHQGWRMSGKGRRLVIVRPSVIFGPGDPGNVLRMIRGIKKGTFILPDGGRVVKGYGYIQGLVESMLFVISRESEPEIVYNYAEDPLVPLNEMVEITKRKLGYSRPVLKVPVSLLVLAARGIQLVAKITGKKSDIHPVRVAKAAFPTHIEPGYLKKAGFSFSYSFENALTDWLNKTPEDFSK